MTYSRRYGTGFVDKPAQGTPIDSTFLNNVEDALLKLFGVAPGFNAPLIWDGTKFRADNLITGFNIDAAAAIDKTQLGPLNIVDADVAGSAAIASSKIAGVAKVTTQAMSSGPPASPVDKDIWIATGIGAGGTRWQFQYDSSWVTDSFKWKFIGGPPLMLSEDAALSTTSGAAGPGAGAGNPAVTTFTSPRAGIYQARTVAATANNSTNINSFQFENNAVPQLAVAWDSVAGTVVSGVVFSEMEHTMTASTNLRTLISTTGGTFTISLRRMSVIPVRII